MFILIILFFALFSEGYAKNVKLNFSSKISNFTEIGIGDTRLFLGEIFKTNLEIKSKISKVYLDVVVDAKEPNLRSAYSRYQFNVNPYIDVNFSFLKLGFGSYTDDNSYRYNESKEYMLTISSYGTEFNFLGFIEPNFNFKKHDCDFYISCLTGFQKSNSNNLKMIVYKMMLNVETDFDALFNYRFRVSLGKIENFQTVRPFNVNDAVDFLDSFRIKARISTEDVFNIKASQILSLSNPDKKIKCSIFTKEAIYYIRTQESIHKCTLVLGLGLENYFRVFYLDFKFIANMDFVHYMHTQENKIWFNTQFEMLFPLSF